jgi:hypothetical protein
VGASYVNRMLVASTDRLTLEVGGIAQFSDIKGSARAGAMPRSVRFVTTSVAANMSLISGGMT